jgi:hypothetical protein
MTLLRCCNAGQEIDLYRGRSLGSVFGVWSANNYRVRWFQNTVSRLFAKFGEQRHTFKFSLTKLALDQATHSCRLMHDSRAVLIRWFCDCFVLILHYSPALSMQNKRTHQDISGIFWFTDPKRLWAVVNHNNHCWSLDFGYGMPSQHPGLSKYWLSTYYAVRADL